MTADEYVALPLNKQFKIRRAWMDNTNERGRIHRANLKKKNVEGNRTKK